MLNKQELNNVALWMSANKLSLNIDKTKYILFDSNPKRLSNCSQALYFSNKPLEQVHDVQKVIMGCI